MTDFYIDIGDTTSFTKTVSESDVYQFAGITGDFSPNHVTRVYMQKSSYGRLMAHGALLVGFMSTVSTQIIAHSREAEETPVSVGYDKVRFLKPVFLGDTVTVVYTVTEIDRGSNIDDSSMADTPQRAVDSAGRAPRSTRRTRRPSSATP